MSRTKKALAAAVLGLGATTGAVVATTGVASAYTVTCTELGPTSGGTLMGCADSDGDLWLEIW